MRMTFMFVLITRARLNMLLLEFRHIFDKHVNMLFRHSIVYGCSDTSYIDDSVYYHVNDCQFLPTER